MPITEEEIQDVADKIAREFNPEKVILFGSYAWGTPGPDSDLDFLIVTKTENTINTARAIDGAFMGRKFAMDILVYRPEYVRQRLAMNDSFLRQVMHKGKTLYEHRRA